MYIKKIKLKKETYSNSSLYLSFMNRKKRHLLVRMVMVLLIKHHNVMTGCCYIY